VKLLETMIKIRLFEEQVALLAKNKEIFCPVHLSVGQEGIAAGVCSVLTKKDYAVSTHRNHAHYLAKGGDPEKLIAEIFCRKEGASGGRGGSMHVSDKNVGFLMSSAIVAGTISIGVGAGLSAKLKKDNRVSVVFFGDGATDEGVFYESLNMATLYKLPVLFVCENNNFSTHMPGFLRQSNPNVAERIAGFNLLTDRVDGNKVTDVREAALKMVEHMRKGNGPALLECDTYRWLAHVGWEDDYDIGYRLKKDILSWKERCPIKDHKNKLISEKTLTEEDFLTLEAREKKEVSRILDWAKNLPSPDASSISEKLFV
jgi:TPP-dependent pyruvate/acetoin dehydrogenase alpha subunit